MTARLAPQDAFQSGGCRGLPAGLLICKFTLIGGPTERRSFGSPRPSRSTNPLPRFSCRAELAGWSFGSRIHFPLDSPEIAVAAGKRCRSPRHGSGSCSWRSGVEPATRGNEDPLRRHPGAMAGPGRLAAEPKRQMVRPAWSRSGDTLGQDCRRDPSRRGIPGTDAGRPVQSNSEAFIAGTCIGSSPA